jgi:cytochrome c-type biogenesis protein CcsB
MYKKDKIMRQILSFIGSMKSMVVLMMIFAFAIGYATIIENDFGTITAKAEIYNARWFEVLLGLLAINLIYNIIHYKMYTLKKAPIFIFHVAFLIILIGAAITRYVGYEGMMHIREGESTNTIVSSDPFITLQAQSNGKKNNLSEVVFLSSRGDNSFSKTLKVDGKDVSFKLLEYIPNAVETLVADTSGKPIVKLMVTRQGRGEPVALAEGEYFDAGNFVIDFNTNYNFSKPVVSFFLEGKKLFMRHSKALDFFKMSDKSQGVLDPSAKDPLNSRVLYTMDNGSSFVLREFMSKAKKKLVSSDSSKVNRRMNMNASGIDALRFLVNVDGNSKELLVFGKKGIVSNPTTINVSGVQVSAAYGAIEIALPFKIKLVDFELERYPGSMSPASYASEVELIDNRNGVKMPYRIYMNHILEYDGYRFFQSSYDMDERGTVLSVNHDPGTLPTYIGYALLALGMFWVLFSRKYRFGKLSKKAKKAAECKVAPLILMALFVAVTLPLKVEAADTSTATILSFDKEHAKKFGSLVVQDTKGRMKPIDTLATEILAKIHRSATLEVDSVELTPNQVILGMMIRPDVYKDIKLIRTKDEKINLAIGAKKDAKYVAFSQFFEDPVNMRGYKLSEIVDRAARKAPKDRNKLDKKALEIDEKVNVVYMVFTGSLLKIWPKLDDPNNKWYATIDALKNFPENEALQIRSLALAYFTSIDSAIKTKKWDEADSNLANIATYQKKYGSAVYPSEDKIKAEIFYNHSNIFEILWPLYFVIGFILLILSFVKIVKPSFEMQKVTKISLVLLAIFFVAHTAGLVLRWYISGHAPWSNGFESMIYIAWATVLAGFIFSKQSPITLASTSILAGLILFVAHLNWMNPQITNLVPVLNSYWLSIHVSMITASYGFLGLGALLGFITLLLYIFGKGENQEQIALSIKELNAINEMSLLIGLVMLTVGNFLGGVWANESWGRYWGWDPKETWALVTILVYAVVVHLRFIKSIYTQFNYSVISLLAFTSVLMTYFGVNYYLAGMHSYAKGDPVPIPDFVPWSYAVVFVVIVLAYRNRKIA